MKNEEDECLLLQANKPRPEEVEVGEEVGVAAKPA